MMQHESQTPIAVDFQEAPGQLARRVDRGELLARDYHPVPAPARRHDPTALAAFALALALGVGAMATTIVQVRSLQSREPLPAPVRVEHQPVTDDGDSPTPLGIALAGLTIAGLFALLARGKSTQTNAVDTCHCNRSRVSVRVDISE